MDFTIEHTFPGLTVAAYQALYFEEPFSIAMCEAVKVGRTLLRLDREPGRLVRHVRCEPIREIPGPIMALLGGHRFAYVEELEFDLTKGEGTWRVIPNIAPDKVDCHGTLRFENVGADVRRTVRGQIAFSMFGVGKLVEKFVVGEVQKSYDGAAEFTRGYLERTRGERA